jgi:hypothetical protein
MTEQQQHLSQLLQQRESLSARITADRETLLKVQGAIEYLTQIGVTLPQESETAADEAPVEITETEE